MAEGLPTQPGGVVGDAGDRGTLQPRLRPGLHLAGGGHADCVGPKFLQHAHFRGGFVLRPEQPGVDSFVQDDFRLRSSPSECFTKARRIGR